jgi:hypothetical protein
MFVVVLMWSQDIEKRRTNGKSALYRVGRAA